MRKEGRMEIKRLDKVSPLRIIIAILAIYRLARLFSRDDGPFFAFKRIRLYTDKKAQLEQEKLRVRFENKEFEDEETILLGPWSSANEGIFCPFCVGLYIAVLCRRMLFFPTAFGEIFLGIFALAGAQTLLQSWSE